MLELNGKYSKAKIYTDDIEEKAKNQIIELCNQSFAKDSKIRIMPDVHAGSGCVIGFTADLSDKVIPNIVGVDIGCGMFTVELGDMDLNLKTVDSIINNYVPHGFSHHNEPILIFDKIGELYCYDELYNVDRIHKSIGTLGGGNHFIEINEDIKDNKYLVIHSGSRNLGKQVADYYQSVAISLHSGEKEYEEKRQKILQGDKKEIQIKLKELKENQVKQIINKDLCYLTGEWRERYLHDMYICQRYAKINREKIADIILRRLGYHLPDMNNFHTTHNYISPVDNIIRKGAVSARCGEKILIPINMRDGSILAVGKGNENWNNSAPHGAGRLMGRMQAKRELNISEFKNTMKDVYTTSVCESTLDEAPMAYKPIHSILDNIIDTVDVIEVIKPIYNFKAK